MYKFYLSLGLAFLPSLLLGQIIDTLCVGFTENVYRVDGLPNSDFSWSISNGVILSGQGTDSVHVRWPNESGKYQIEVVEISQWDCPGDTQRAEILVIDAPAVAIIAADSLCKGEDINIIAKSETDIEWFNGSNEKNLTLSLEETTEVFFKTMNECGNITINKTIEVLEYPMITLEFPQGKQVCPNEFIEVIAIGNAEQFVWSNGDFGPQTLVYSPGELLLTASNGICEITEAFSAQDCYNIIVNNTFTPDGDGVNDYLEIEGIAFYPNSKIEIYNRWGSIVYASNNGYNNDWDGTFNGQALPVGSYYYAIDLDGSGSKAIKSGYINIIRR